MISRRRMLQAAAAALPLAAQQGRTVFVVPNFHPASCGWLTNFSKERVYCANSYFDHLDRVRDDPNYAFVLSEVNNLVAMLNFQPGRADELKQRIREGRVELVNAFFLESTVNLSGGEALVRLGVEGLRWQQQVFGVRPRIAWTIDVCGTHDQMAQISAGLGLEAMVYTRKNPTGSALHWAESPDGSRILASSPGHYSELGRVMASKSPLSPGEMDEVRRAIEAKVKITPAGAPILILAGSGDYALAPARKEYPSELLSAWQRYQPGTTLRFATFSQYLDAVLPDLKAGRIQIPTMRGGTAYDFDAFWIQSPRMKSWFRRNEHALQTAEMLAAISSLVKGYRYPVQTLYHAWLQTFLSMDRNTLWGAAGGMVFEHDRSWDARERLQGVETIAAETVRSAAKALLAAGAGIGLFNPLNWTRSDPVAVRLPEGKSVEGAACERLADGSTLMRVVMAPVSAGGWKLAPQPAPRPRPIPVPYTIETRHYSLRLDPATGTLASLKLKPSGREILSGGANVVVGERPVSWRGDPGDHILARPGRTRLASTDSAKPDIGAVQGPLAITLEIRGAFMGAPCVRLVRCHLDHPRIDFETELNDIPDRTVVVAEFPLADAVTEVRRGIPYGFSHGAWEKPDPGLHGWTKGITPAVRWTHYSFASGGGAALFDRGLTGREINGRTPLIYLYNATDKYYGYANSWLSGKGKHRVSYALLAHDGDWGQARIPHCAWEYNCPPAVIADVAPSPARTFLATSANVIVESVRRDRNDLEVRLVECLGRAGKVDVTVSIPHRGAAITDLTGSKPVPLKGGPQYQFAIRAQQIVTLRFRTAAPVGEVRPLLEWDPLVPAAKRPALHEYSEEKGHPPRG